MLNVLFLIAQKLFKNLYGKIFDVLLCYKNYSRHVETISMKKNSKLLWITVFKVTFCYGFFFFFLRNWQRIFYERRREEKVYWSKLRSIAMKILGNYSVKFGSTAIQESNFYQKLPEYYLTIFLANFSSVSVPVHTALCIAIDLRIWAKI